MSRRFAVFDVFSDKPLAGNQLGVVYDSEGLTTKQMQAIALEFNVAETVFLAPAEQDGHAAKVRIFTTQNELPFAGPPTVGSAIAVALDQGMDDVGQALLILEETIGPVRCAVRFDGNAPYAAFDLPKLATVCQPASDRLYVAEALSIEKTEIGFENHVISNFDGGLSYDLVPVRDLSVISKAKPVAANWRRAFGNRSHVCTYVYCRETVGAQNHFHARMFGPLDGFEEDPATGSAVASFAGAIAQFEDLPDGNHTFNIEQGVEMGRPSLITLEMEMSGGEFISGRIGGNAVEFSRGTLTV